MEAWLRYPEYNGMSYERASRATIRLIERNDWLQNLDRLAALREIMLLELRLDNQTPNNTRRRLGLPEIRGTI